MTETTARNATTLSEAIDGCRAAAALWREAEQQEEAARTHLAAMENKRQVAQMAVNSTRQTLIDFVENDSRERVYWSPQMKGREE